MTFLNSSHNHKIAITDDYQGVALGMADWPSLGCEIEVFRHPFESVEQAAAALQPFSIVCAMRERLPLPRTLVEKLPRLRLIVTTGSHNRAIDLRAAAEHGITVCHTRSGNTEHPTAELTWALILAAARSLARSDRDTRAGEWQQTIGATLYGKTLGIVGLGRIGRRVASIATAFGMAVLAWSPNLTAERAHQASAAYTSKEQLFLNADVVSLHLVLAPATREIIGARELDLMRKDAILVNTSRAGLVDERALVTALMNRRIRAGLDVFWREPLPREHPLCHLDNVVLTPHLGYVARESYDVFFRDAVEDIRAFLDGNPVRVLRAQDH